MTSALAIVSKAAFKKVRAIDGLPPRLGVKLDIDRYDSQHPVLEAVAGGAIFLVTVLPGDVLWLVAMLGAVKRWKGTWKSHGSMMPVVDLTPVCAKLGIERGDGKLAMRLQTPRLLDERQWEILHQIEVKANAATRAGRAKPAKPPKPVKVPKLAKGKFAFVNARTLDADAIRTLDKVHEQQFIDAIDLYAGIRKKTGAATLAAFLVEQDWQPDDFSIALWDVYEGGRKTPRFEFWVQGAGDGTLFHHGRATSPNIGSTQHSFESHDPGDEDARTLALIDALQAAAEKSGAV